MKRIITLFVVLGLSLLRTFTYSQTQVFLDFSSGSLPPGWNYQSIVFVDSTCTPAPGAGIFAWALGAFPRYIETPDMNTGTGTLTFNLVYAIQGVPNPCEGPDDPRDGVSVQYSTDGGNTWEDITYFHPDGYQQQSIPVNPPPILNYDPGITPFTQWATYQVPIPSGANSPNTRFRWYQVQGSGNIYDSWGLDSLTVSASATTANIINYTDQSINVYPNPTDASLYVIIGNTNETSSYKILDQTGRVVHTGTMNGNTTINMESFASGVYFLQLSAIHSKLIKIIKK